MLHVFGSNSLVDNFCQHVGLQYWAQQQLSGVARVPHFIHNLHNIQQHARHSMSLQKQLEMWANAQRDGRPAEYTRTVQRRSLADAHY